MNRRCLIKRLWCKYAHRRFHNPLYHNMLMMPTHMCDHCGRLWWQ